MDSFPSPRDGSDVGAQVAPLLWRRRRSDMQLPSRRSSGSGSPTGRLSPSGRRSSPLSARADYAGGGSGSGARAVRPESPGFAGPPTGEMLPVPYPADDGGAGAGSGSSREGASTLSSPSSDDSYGAGLGPGRRSDAVPRPQYVPGSMPASGAVEARLAAMRAMPAGELLDLMEDRVTDMMDLSMPYHTPFALPPEPSFSRGTAGGGSGGGEAIGTPGHARAHSGGSTGSLGAGTWGNSADGEGIPVVGPVEDSERVLRLLCRQIVNSADNHVVFDPDINQTDDSMAVLLTTLKADYLRQLAELELEHMRANAGVGGTDPRVARKMKQPELDRAFQAYRSATEHAFDTLPPTHSLRLHTALKFAMFCSESLHQPRLAFETAEQAYLAGNDALPSLPPEQMEDVAPLLQRLRDRVSLWSTEVDLLDSDSMDELSDDGAPAQNHGGEQRHDRGRGAPRLPPASKSGHAMSDATSDTLSAEGLSLGKSTSSPRRHRPFSPVSTVLSASVATTPREWLSTLRQRKEKQRTKKKRGRRGFAAVGRMAALALRGRRGGGDDDTEGETESSLATGAIGLGQVEAVMSQMPRGPATNATSLTDAISMIPPLHEIFSQYSPAPAASGTRQDGGTVVFEKSSMDMHAFVNKSLGVGPDLPQEDLLRFLKDFKVVPKLLSEDDITVMIRMTLRGFPKVLQRSKPKRTRGRRRRSSMFGGHAYDPTVLLPDDDGPLTLTYHQYLDVLGRVAVAAFAQPPYRSRYDTTQDRIEGFVRDYLGVCDDEGAWRLKMSARPLPAAKTDKRLGYTIDQSAPTGMKFNLSGVAKNVLQEAGNRHALTLLFNFYRRVHIPRGVLFSDIASESTTIDTSELMKFAVDFGLAPKMIGQRTMEAIYRAEQKQSRSVGTTLGKAARRRQLASAQASALTFPGFLGVLGRIAVEAKMPVPADAGAEASSHVYKVRQLLRILGLPEPCSRHDADVWWGQTRNNLVEGGKGSPQREQPAVGRPVQWGATGMYVTTTGLHKMPSLREMTPTHGPGSPDRLSRAKSAPRLTNLGPLPEGAGEGGGLAPPARLGTGAPQLKRSATTSKLPTRKVWRPQLNGSQAGRPGGLRRSSSQRIRASRPPPFAPVHEGPESSVDSPRGSDHDGASVGGTSSVGSSTWGGSSYGAVGGGASAARALASNRHAVGRLPIGRIRRSRSPPPSARGGTDTEGTPRWGPGPGVHPQVSPLGESTESAGRTPRRSMSETSLPSRSVLMGSVLPPTPTAAAGARAEAAEAGLVTDQPDSSRL